MYDELMTVGTLTTFVGLVAATSLIVQFTKSIIKKQIGDNYVRLYAFVISLILVFVFARNSEGLQGIIVTIINSIIITISAMGGYEVVTDSILKK